jgi:hypothetical protein
MVFNGKGAIEKTSDKPTVAAASLTGGPVRGAVLPFADLYCRRLSLVGLSKLDRCRSRVQMREDRDGYESDRGGCAAKASRRLA